MRIVAFATLGLALVVPGLLGCISGLMGPPHPVQLSVPPVAVPVVSGAHTTAVRPFLVPGFGDVADDVFDDCMKGLPVIGRMPQPSRTASHSALILGSHGPLRSQVWVASSEMSSPGAANQLARSQPL